MNRRDLLKLLGGAVVATAAGVLIPADAKRRTYFLPPDGGWRSFEFAEPQRIYLFITSTSQRDPVPLVGHPRAYVCSFQQAMDLAAKGNAMVIGLGGALPLPPSLSMPLQRWKI